MSGTVEAVIFDWGGTLTPWHTVDVAEIWASTYAASAFPRDQRLADRLARALVAADAAAWTRGREEHVSASLEQIVATACAAADVAHAAVSTQAAADAYARAWEPHTLTDPSAATVLRDLRARGIKVGVLSNTIWSRGYHRGIFERDDVLHLIDADVYSSEIDWVKPHPETFLLAARAVSAAPQRCVYVGDRMYEDIWGPAQVGIRTIYIPHSDVPAEHVVQIDAQPDAVAASLTAVSEIVSGWHTSAATNAAGDTL
ncbi:MAG: HAD family hydrolase [Ornithinimicrobium sp.]